MAGNHQPPASLRPSSAAPDAHRNPTAANTPKTPLPMLEGSRVTAPYYSDESVTLHLGDCLDVMAELPDCSVDAVVTDPPYGLEFMGKDWDSFKPASSRGAGGQFANGTIAGYAGKPMPRYGKRWTQRRCTICGHVDGGASPCRCERPAWTTTTEPGTPRFASSFQDWCLLWTVECLRVLKPGGHLLSFGGSRTWHRLAVAIEDGGFELRDSIAWLYGQGFAKSRDVGRSIDSELCGLPGKHFWSDGAMSRSSNAGHVCPFTAAGDEHRGEGTALKPAFEPIVVGRKPLIGAVAANVLAHGTGALNIDACRTTCEPIRTTRNTALGVMNDDGWKPQSQTGDVSPDKPTGWLVARQDGLSVIAGILRLANLVGQPWLHSGRGTHEGR